MIKDTQSATIVFTGDSITDGHWRLDEYAPYGKGYVDFAANRLLAGFPVCGLNVINSGLAGNTSRDLKSRWDADVLEKKPNIVSLLIGINDIWRKYEEDKFAEHVPLNEYLSNLQYMLESLVAEKIKVVLIEPFMFCSDMKNQMFADLKLYQKALFELSQNYDIIYIPMQKLIISDLDCTKTSMLSNDMVHPERWVHAWIAEKWLEYVEVFRT